MTPQRKHLLHLLLMLLPQLAGLIYLRDDFPIALSLLTIMGITALVGVISYPRLK